MKYLLLFLVSITSAIATTVQAPSRELANALQLTLSLAKPHELEGMSANQQLSTLYKKKLVSMQQALAMLSELNRQNLRSLTYSDRTDVLTYSYQEPDPFYGTRDNSLIEARLTQKALVLAKVESQQKPSRLSQTYVATPAEIQELLEFQPLYYEILGIIPTAYTIRKIDDNTSTSTVSEITVLYRITSPSLTLDVEASDPSKDSK